MVAYSFQQRFVEPIQKGVKRQTVRGTRKRHARPGESIQLYVGMRTKSCRKIIDDPICLTVQPIAIVRNPNEPDAWITEIIVAGVEVDPDQFAIDDGFKSLDEMSAFWLRHAAEFTGPALLIRWGNDPQ